MRLRQECWPFRGSRHRESRRENLSRSATVIVPAARGHGAPRRCRTPATTEGRREAAERRDSPRYRDAARRAEPNARARSQREWWRLSRREWSWLDAEERSRFGARECV